MANYYGQLKWPIMREGWVIQTLFCILTPLTRSLCIFWTITWPSYSKNSVFGKNGQINGRFWPFLRKPYVRLTQIIFFWVQGIITLLLIPIKAVLGLCIEMLIFRLIKKGRGQLWELLTTENYVYSWFWMRTPILVKINHQTY